MKNRRLRRNKSLSDFLFFFGFIFITITIFISFVTLKNDCIFVRNEIHHMENIRMKHANRVKVLDSQVKNLTRQDHIEQVAFEKFHLHHPNPESLVVYIGD